MNMLNALEARAQSETAAKVIADEQAREKGLILNKPRDGSWDIADYLTGCLEEKVYNAIKEGQTSVTDWWPCDDLATWMGHLQDVKPFFVARGYEITGKKSQDNGAQIFVFMVSW